MADNKTNAQKTPLLRIRSHFSPLLVIYHHPVRLAVSLAIPFMLLPELRRFVQAEWKLDLQEARIASVLGIILVVFVPQLLASALNCRNVVYRFYDDHIEFTENFLMRDAIRLSYTSIKGAALATGVMQRLAGVSDVVLILHGRMAGRQQGQLQQVIHDVRKAPAALKQIEKILQAWQRAQQPPPPKTPEPLTD